MALADADGPTEVAQICCPNMVFDSFYLHICSFDQILTSLTIKVLTQFLRRCIVARPQRYPPKPAEKFPQIPNLPATVP